MKYLWIIILIIIDIIWFIVSLIDFIKTARRTKINHILDELEDYTTSFMILHLIGLFVYSLSLFILGTE